MPGLSPKDIEALEQELGCVLPADVRAKYTESDGFLGPSSCRLLYPYGFADDTQVVQLNSMLKAEDWFPASLTGIAILGDDGCGNHLCFDPNQGRAIKWNPEDGDWIQAEFPTMTDLWAHVLKFYASVA